MEKLWPFEAQGMNDDFFGFFVISSFAHIFPDISISGQRLWFWERTVIHFSFKNNFNEIEQKELKIFFFFFEKSTISKKFYQIKNVKIQIGRYGSQKAYHLNRLKISQKLHLPWLFKVLRIMFKKILKTFWFSNYD